MSASSHDTFLRRLAQGRNGGAILFCGAGFSADCLSFKPDETLGTGAQLLNLFNSELDQVPPFRDLRNAADKFWQERGESQMETLLKEKFAVADVTADMVDLLRYPWEAIYTTNYDDALEKCAQSANCRTESFNNTDHPETSAKTPIIHLHGYIHKWDIHNIRGSCVLGAESYDRLTEVKKWLNRFRRDIDKAGIVVFVGFNAGDIHLNQAIYDITGLSERTFFINRPTADADPDIAATQARFGTPFYFGRSGLAGYIRDVMAADAPKEPHLACFAKFEPPTPAASGPTSAQIEDLFVFGDVSPELLARDTADGTSSYHVPRKAMHDALDAIAAGKRIILFEGHPCDGKTMLTTALAQRLSGSRPVYRLRLPYESLLNEVSAILQYAPNAVLVIENCFDLPTDRLDAIARQADGYDAILVLTSRAVAVDASPKSLAVL